MWLAFVQSEHERALDAQSSGVTLETSWLVIIVRLFRLSMNDLALEHW